MARITPTEVYYPGLIDEKLMDGRPLIKKPHKYGITVGGFLVFDKPNSTNQLFLGKLHQSMYDHWTYTIGKCSPIVDPQTVLNYNETVITVKKDPVEAESLDDLRYNKNKYSLMHLVRGKTPIEFEDNEHLLYKGVIFRIPQGNRWGIFCGATKMKNNVISIPSPCLIIVSKPDDFCLGLLIMDDGKLLNEHYLHNNESKHDKGRLWFKSTEHPCYLTEITLKNCGSDSCPDVPNWEQSFLVAVEYSKWRNETEWTLVMCSHTKKCPLYVIPSEVIHVIISYL